MATSNGTYPTLSNSSTFWWAVRTLLRRRIFIIGFTTVAAIAAVVISLLLPNWYGASARLLMPEGGSGAGLGAALLRNISGAAASLLGGGGGDYTRYMALLTSRTLREEVVQEFDLIAVYENTDSETPLEDTLKDLDGNTELEVDIEYEFLSITVFDKDPERAAAMSNFMVDRLNEMNGRLSSQHARVFRTSVEGRFNQAMADLDSLKNRTRDFQARYGVFDLEAQASAFLELVAQSRAEAIKLEIQHRGLLEQYGPDNPQVQLLGRMVEEAERTYQASLAGQEMVLPVSQAEVPQVNREFMDLEQDRLIQEAVLEVIAPIYEQAKFEEAREVTAVQIVDRAIPPARKARPARGIICILTTLSAGLLAVIYVLGSAWWTVQAPMVAAHLREPQPAPSPDVTV